jgi:LysR family hydrogen peroxide-inducible transcriptional activator
MKNITLKQLRYFEALSRHGHFGHAAAACAISQPALSVQIKELEQSLGVALFERGPRQVRLTAFGVDFAVRVRDILQSVDALSDLARAAQEGFVGRLRIGVIPTIAPYLLPGLIRHMGQAFPGLDVQFRETVTPRLVEELSEGQIDTTILALPIDDPTFAEVVLFTEEMVLVRPMRDAQAPVPEPAALRGMRLLLLEEGHCFRDQAISFCNLRAPLAADGLDGSSLSTLVQMVGAGIGVTLIPEMAIQVEERAAPVCIGRFRDPAPSRTVGMIWRKSNPLAGQLQKVSEVVRRAGEEVVGA